jgi:hypothetical protein
MRIPRLASSIALLVVLAAPPLAAQTPGDDTSTDSQPAAGAGGDDTRDGTEEPTGTTPPRTLDAEQDAEQPARELASEAGDDEDNDDQDNDDAENDDEAEDDESSVEKDVVTRTEVRSVDNSRVGVSWNEDLDEFQKRYQWSLLFGGFVRTQYTAVQNDPGNGIIGQNDGFILGNARFTLDGSMRETFGFRIQFDGAVDRNRSPNTASGEVVTRLRDAFIFWEPLEFLRLEVGQFKSPFDVEEIYITDELLFVERSVGSRGLRGIEGFNQPGLSIQREVGVQLIEPGYFPFATGDENEGFGVSYGLAVTNGESANRTRNDNDQLAYYGRLGLHWGDWIRVGGAVYQNNSLVGEQPDVIAEDRLSYTGDVTIHAFGVTAIASVIQLVTSTPEVELEPEETALSYQFSLAYKEPFLGFEPAVRYAYYDPTDAIDNDALTYITAGLNYRPDYPLTVMVNYTLTNEQEGRELQNDRFDFMLQVEW